MTKLEKTCKHIKYCNVRKVRNHCRDYETCQTYKFYEKYPQVLLNGYSDINSQQESIRGEKLDAMPDYETPNVVRKDLTPSDSSHIRTHPVDVDDPENRCFISDES